MTKEGYVEYWISNSKKDWKRAENCFRDKDYVFCLFCIHLSLEKICKALWVKNSKENVPPRIHNLERLLMEAKIKLAESDMVFMRDMNTFQIEGRYPDYLGKIYKTYNKKFTAEIFEKAKSMRKWLTGMLQ